jgi:ribosomal protein L29
MQHPFIHDLSEKTLDELQTSISDLNKKLNFAYRIQNGAMINQLRMILESYNSENTKRMDELYKKQNIQNQINISSDKK